MNPTPSAAAGAAGPQDPAAPDLAAQIRELTLDDSHAVHQVVAEVLAALDRATGGFRERTADAPRLGGGYGEPPVRVVDLEALAAEHAAGDGQPGRPGRGAAT